MPDALTVLDDLAATAAIAAGTVFAIGCVPWLCLLLHELAHAAAARLVGARVLGGVVGTGPHVLPLRLFGTRWEFRLRATSGLVLFDAPPARWYRVRCILVFLAGPSMPTSIAIGSFVLLSSPPLHDDAGDMWSAAAKITLLYTACTSAFLAVLGWLPLHWRIGGAMHPGDVLQVWRLLRLRRDAVLAQRAEHAEQAGTLHVWNRFLDGAHEEALRMHRQSVSGAAVRFDHLITEATLAWPVLGGAVSLEILSRAHRAFLLWVREQSGRVAPDAMRRIVREHESLFRVHRAFFALVSGRPELLDVAVQATQELLRGPKRDAPSQRVAGLVELHTGDVRTALSLLRTAWACEEPVWLRVLTALGLGLGCALRGRHDEARHWLRKAKRLHPECVLLPDYEARIRAAALPDARAAAP